MIVGIVPWKITCGNMVADNRITNLAVENAILQFEVFQ